MRPEEIKDYVGQMVSLNGRGDLGMDVDLRRILYKNTNVKLIKQCKSGLIQFEHEGKFYSVPMKNIDPPNEILKGFTIADFIENQDFLVTMHNQRYGGEYIFGIFQGTLELDRLEHASSYEYEQGEHFDLCLRPGVLPFVVCKNIEEGIQKLNAILSMVTVANRNEYYQLMDFSTMVFPKGGDFQNPPDMNWSIAKDCVYKLQNFKNKYKD